MGQLFARNNGDVEQANGAGPAYCYPPPNGAYFGNRFQLGNETFDTTEPESYLFGDNHDLNFLGRRPSQFPYPAPQLGEPTRTIRSLINIRKDTLKLVRKNGNSDGYHIEFIFDCDVNCTVNFYLFATEDVENGKLKYVSKRDKLAVPQFAFKRGSGQVFKEKSGYEITPTKWNQDELTFNRDKPHHYPLVIHIEASSEGNRGHSHCLIGSFEKNSDGSYSLKPVKQKQMVDGCLFVLQEIYGLENKEKKSNKLLSDTEDEADIDDDNVDTISQNGIECVICMGDPKDTLFLPCRHLCVCHECAESLREQSSNCPICRQPFKALLRLEALKRCSADAGGTQDGSAKYVSVPLIEALDSCSGTGVISPSPHDIETIDENEDEDGRVVVVKPAEGTAPSVSAVDVVLPGTPANSETASRSSSFVPGSGRKVSSLSDDV
ncbi:E3 ubiquitin ligase Rnf157-like [Oscarella lobularis]|uniref:E3 ubiquitin ligase Rnf157-like n=1 Tax=Oscarella lobularis TaxID=121494 RepID=UPI00331398C7